MGKFSGLILQNIDIWFAEVCVLVGMLTQPVLKMEENVESLLRIINVPMYYKGWNIAMQTIFIGMDTFLGKKKKR